MSSEAEAALELEVALLGRRRARVGEPQRVVGVVRALGLAHQDLEHRADRVELGGAVAPGGVEEPAGREAGEQHEARARGDRAQHRVRGRVDVEERQRRHQPVVRGQPEPPGEALGGHRVGAVGLGHELGAPGRARGGDQHRRVVVRRRAGPSSSPGSANSSSSVRRRVTDELRLDLADQAVQLGLRLARVHAHVDRARGRRVASQRKT